jgi:hypothetical protein
LVSGLGSDLSEEPAVQDVEPVTLDYESFLDVLPGPFGIIDEVPVVDVGDPPLQRSERFYVVLPSATLRSK